MTCHLSPRRRDLLSDPRLAASRAAYEQACLASRTHSAAAKIALNIYGDHGAIISGCVRDHFPEYVKNALRQYAGNVTTFCDLGRALRPKGVRKATIIRLGQDVATRDGSGFYGPQPRR